MTTKRFRNAVMPMVELCKKYGVLPSFPVTASAVKRNPDFFQELQGKGAELSIHGLLHFDYTLIDEETVKNHYACAINIFKESEIEFNGFRFPYLRRDPERVDLLRTSGFEWESSEVLSWTGINKSEVSHLQWDAYQKILQTYQAVSIDETVAIPYFRDTLVEIPVSVPDDDILIERVGFSSDIISMIWQNMVQRSSEMNEMLVLQLHPERFRKFKKPLLNILSSLNEYPESWNATLRDISDWWKVRKSIKMNVKSSSSNTWEIDANLPENGSVLVRNLQPYKYTKKLDDKSGFMSTVPFKIQSEKMPVVGVHPECHTWITDHLNNDGFPVKKTEDQNSCSCFIAPESVKNSRELSNRIQKATSPLVQIWRWPNMKSWCFCVSGDIDGITLMDFWDRTHGYQ